jgi:hypothetical protein
VPAASARKGIGQRTLGEFDERIVIRQTLAVYGELLGGQGVFAPEWVEILGRIDAQLLPGGRE